MSRPAPLVLPLCLLALWACGAPTAGSRCSKAGYDCIDEKTAAECRAGAWVAIPCRGKAGCAVAGGEVSCDSSGAVPGDACASSQEGKGFCTPPDVSRVQAYVCTNGVYQVTPCRTCDETGGQVTCQP